VLESAQDRSPRLQVARAWYEVHERALQLEIRKQYPDLTLSPGLGNEDGMDEVLLGISLPLPVLNRNRRAIAEATAAREAARAEVEGEVEALVAELAAAAAQFNSAAQRRRTFEQEIVPMVDAQYADSRRTAELGEVNTLVLLESMGRQQEAKTRLIESRRDEARAAIRIDQLVGPPAEGAKP
jgi:cobalt-zinc-cadmium efflux system outer membrane protein